MGKDEALYQYLLINHPELVEDDREKPHMQAVVEIPQKAPEGSILRSESPLDLLNRVSKFNAEWVRAGHREGQNAHNVSCTIPVKPDEWELVGEWMWKNRNAFNGISVFPFFEADSTQPQLPFEDITEERFNMLSASLHELDLTKVIEVNDMTDLSAEAACAGGACEITF